MSDGNGELPEGWAEADLGEIADVQWGNTTLTKKSYTEDGFTAFSASGPDGFLGHFEHEGEGIVLSAIGARCGKCFKADGQWTSIKNTITVTDFAPGLVTRDFLFPLLNDESRWRKKGGGQPFIALKGARVEKVPLPPLAEQRRIVSKIESLQERSSRARRALSEVGPLLEQFRQSVLRAAFSGRLTADWRAAHRDVEPATELLSRIRTERRHRWEQSELAKYEAKGKQPPKNWQDKYTEPEPVDETELRELPDGWCWVHLDELADVQLGQRRAPEFSKLEEYPYIRAGNITWKGLDLSEVKTMGFASPDGLLLESGDILLNEASGSPREVGKPALWRDEVPNCCFQATVLRLRSRDDSLRPEWLYFNRLFDALLGEYAAQTPGIGIIHLTAKLMRRWPIPFAPVEEQDEAIKRLNAVLELIDSWEESVAESESALTQLDQSILAKAFRGELVPQDPRDEPASELLARIRTTRDTGPGTTPRRRTSATTAAPLSDAPPFETDDDEPSTAAEVAASLTAADAPAPPAATPREGPLPIDETDRNDVMAAIRSVFTTHSDGLDREDAIRHLAHELGYKRTGHRIHEILGNDLIAALKRRILSKDGDRYVLHCRSIEDYERDDLVSLLQRAMGNTWWEEADAIREATRLLGFRRTGATIHDTWKKTIALALRRGELEREGTQIRRSK